MSNWARGSVVTITDPAHPGAVCVLTSDKPANDDSAWLLVDATCCQWRSSDWVEARHPVPVVKCERCGQSRSHYYHGPGAVEHAYAAEVERSLA